MSLYLSAETLSDAVGRLSMAAARSSLADYLIVRRALVLGGTEGVTLSQRDEPFIQALRETTATTQGDDDDESEDKVEPYFSPFGAARDRRNRGFKSRKYASNGTSNTVMDWHGKQYAPVVRVPDTRPAQVRLVPDLPPSHLTEFFISGPQQPPSLLDTALWWHRFTELESRFGGPPSQEDLRSSCIADLGLHNAEVNALFDTSLMLT